MSDNCATTFGPRLTALRSAAGLTIYALAKLAKVPRQYIAEVERGEKTPGWAIVCKLADTLGVSVEEFRK